jgi:hypothetical protein
MEKVIIKETLRKAKPESEKKKSYKPRKKKEDKKEESKILDNEFVMRANEIPHIKVPKQVGSYKVGKSFHIFFEKKPNVVHRFFTKLFLGWQWQDQK